MLWRRKAELWRDQREGDGIVKTKYADNGPMLNAYPDSMGEKLSDITGFLRREEIRNAFSSFYILPSVFHTDLDRGFSVIDYELNELLADEQDLKELRELGIGLKLDFILNHASVLSKQFQDLLARGEASEYKDFFINWNRFWEGKGTMTREGYIEPCEALIKNMFFRKPGLPFLMVRMPDGKRVPYWNTFYQEVRYRPLDEQELMREAGMQYSSALIVTSIVNRALLKGQRPEDIEFGKFEAYRERVLKALEKREKYLGQMDLNIKSPLVWEYYDHTLKKLSEYGAGIVRLDAFAYAAKEPGEKNFLNEPGTWDLLAGVQKLADRYCLELLPEIHAGYEEKIYRRLSDKGYMTYDFFLPGLIIDALEEKSGETLVKWAEELYENRIRTVNMLGCHDGVPLLDLKGLIPDERIEKLIALLVQRGGYVKNLHARENIYYQVNITYYSALGEDDEKMLLARALQLFMPGKPQIWYLDLFAGKNDYEAMERAGAGGHKEINRSNLSLEEIDKRMKTEVVRRQIRMLKFRNTFPAFGFEAEMETEQRGSRIEISWSRKGCQALLKADLATCKWEIRGIDHNREREVFLMDSRTL